MKNFIYILVISLVLPFTAMAGKDRAVKSKSQPVCIDENSLLPGEKRNVRTQHETSPESKVDEAVRRSKRARRKAQWRAREADTILRKKAKKREVLRTIENAENASFSAETSGTATPVPAVAEASVRTFDLSTDDFGISTLEILDINAIDSIMAAFPLEDTIAVLSLILPNTQDFSDEDLCKLAMAFPFATSVDMTVKSADSIVNLPRYWPELTCLKIWVSEEVERDSIVRTISALSNLKWLDLRYCPWFTDSDLVKINLSLENLDTLIFSPCRDEPMFTLNYIEEVTPFKFDMGVSESAILVDLFPDLLQ